MLFHVVTIIRPNFDFQKRLGIDVCSGHRCIIFVSMRNLGLQIVVTSAPGGSSQKVQGQVVQTVQQPSQSTSSGQIIRHQVVHQTHNRNAKYMGPM